jgi:glycosyltransferase involved in cell wall biosynthesis
MKGANMARIIQISAIDSTMRGLLGELNRGTVNAGFETIGICSKGNNREQIEKDGVILVDIPIDRKIILSNVKSIIQLYKTIRKYKPDIVHVHTPIAAVLGRIAAKAAKAPYVIYTAHGFYFHENMKSHVYRFFYLIEKYMGKFFTDYIFTQSKEDAQLAIKGKFLPEDRVIWISNGVDVNGKFNPDNINQQEIDNLYNEFNLNQQDFIVSFIGRMVTEKGIYDLLDAFQEIDRTDVKLLVIGGQAQGDRDRNTIEKIKKYQSNPNIIFTGRRGDVNNLLFISDIFCLPSYREGMPRSIIEAMSMENAIIATNIRGSKEEVIDGKTGFLVPIKSPIEIKKKIEILLNDKVLLESMKKLGRKRAVEKYDEKKVVLKQIDIFNSLINK